MSTPQTTSTSSSSSSSSSSTLSTSGKPNTSDNNPNYHHTIYYIIIFLSILGGIVLLSLLGVIAIRYINRRRRNYHRHQHIKDSFWRKWHLNLGYSSVDGDAEASSSNSHSKEGLNMMQKDNDVHAQGYEYDGLAVVEKERRRSGSGIMNWWQRGKSFSRIEEGLGEEYVCVTTKDSETLKKKKEKLGTVHKVKRLKPNDTFEIDSDVRMSVDFTVVPSRCSTRQ